MDFFLVDIESGYLPIIKGRGTMKDLEVGEWNSDKRGCVNGHKAEQDD